MSRRLPQVPCVQCLSRKRRRRRRGRQSVFPCEEVLPNPRYLLSGQDRSRKWPHDEPPRRSAAPQGGQLLPEARRSTPKRGVSIGGGGSQGSGEFTEGCFLRAECTPFESRPNASHSHLLPAIAQRRGRLPGSLAEWETGTSVEECTPLRGFSDLTFSQLPQCIHLDEANGIFDSGVRCCP